MLLLFLLNFLAGITFLTNAQEVKLNAKKSDKHKNPASRIVKSLICSSAGSKRELKLLQVEITPLTGWQLLDYFERNPKENSFPNRAFVLIDSASQSQDVQRLLWIDYLFLDPLIRPSQSLSGDVVCSAAQNEAFVVLMKAGSVNATLSVYQIDLNKGIGSYPIELDPLKYQQWLKPFQPISQTRIELSERGILCGLDRLQASAEPEYLQIRAERADNPCAAVDIRFNLKTEQWSEVSFQKIERKK